MEHSLAGDSSTDFKVGSSHGKLLCLEAPQGATEQNPYLHGVSETPVTWEEHLSPGSTSSENFEVLAERLAPLSPEHKKESLWCCQEAG
jgi:hypothetical protein